MSGTKITKHNSISIFAIWALSELKVKVINKDAGKTIPNAKRPKNPPYQYCIKTIKGKNTIVIAANINPFFLESAKMIIIETKRKAAPP